MQKHIDTFFTRYPRKSLRLIEIILPLISLTLITLPFWGAFLFPIFLAYMIIFFDVWWLYKSFNFARCAYIATRKISKAEKMDWLKKAKRHKDFDKSNHLIIFPNYKEPIEIIADSLVYLKSQTISTKKIIITLAMEKREEEAAEKAEALKKRFGEYFGGFYYTLHPDLKDEVKGKSSNQAYAIKEMEEILKAKIDLTHLTVTTADADSKFDKQYFAYLTDAFYTGSNPNYTIWQSATVFYNNFWDIPAATRVISFFGSLWRTSLLIQGLKLLPHSTYSLSFNLLKEIDYWDTDVIPEDYRIFFKAFFRTKGKVQVDPIFLKTSMDSAHGRTYTRSLLSRYSQERRWAWGISDDPLYIKWWFTVKDVPFLKKTYILGGSLLDHILWPVYWYIITISANAVVFLNPAFSRTALGYTLPRLSGLVLTITLLSLVIMIYTDYILRAKSHPRPSRLRQFLFPLEFVLMPITGFFLSSFPALISHIQLILGKRLEYKVTEKVSK